MDVWEQASLQTTLDAYLFIIGATFKETSFNFLHIWVLLRGFSGIWESPAQTIF